MSKISESEKNILEELHEASKTLVWYSPSQIEAGQNKPDDRTFGDRPWAVSPETGEFLHDFILENKIRNVVELGTGVGYSGLWMLFALSGKLYTIEKRKEKVEIAEKFFRKAKVDEKAKVYNEEIETALTKITSEIYEADLLFFDANRSRFHDYLETLLPIITDRTFLIVDNTIDMKDRLANFKKYLIENGWKIEEKNIGDGLWICQK